MSMSAVQDTSTTDEGKKLLERFEPIRRSYVANTFLYAVRSGARTPLQVLAMVKHNLRETYERAGRWSHISDTAQRALNLFDTLTDHHEEAMAFAHWCFEWERLSPAEKERIRAVKGEQYRRAYMEQQPATDKQVDYIRALGYQGEVTSKAHASELIERLKRGEKVEVVS